MNNKQTELYERQLHEQNPGAEGVHTHKQRGTILHIFTLLPQFGITVFISKFVRLSFQNKHIMLQCESENERS